MRSVTHILSFHLSLPLTICSFTPHTSHIFPITTIHFLIDLSLPLYPLYSYFTYFFDYIFVICSFMMSKPSFHLFSFIFPAIFVTSKILPMYLFLIIYNLVTPYIHFSIFIFVVLICISFFLLIA